MKKKADVFTEIGFDKDNNKYLLGISTEIENEDGSEFRIPFFAPMAFQGIYCRFWIFKTVFSIGYPRGFSIIKKKRNNLKFVLGVSGFKKKEIDYNKYNLKTFD